VGMMTRCAVLLGVVLVSGGCESGQIAMPPQDQPVIVGSAEVGKLVSPARVVQQQAEITAVLREVLVELQAVASELAEAPPHVRTQLRAVPDGMPTRVQADIDAARKHLEASGLATEEHRALLLRVRAAASSIDAALK
jgi:hypothetical protein